MTVALIFDIQCTGKNTHEATCFYLTSDIYMQFAFLTVFLRKACFLMTWLIVSNFTMFHMHFSGFTIIIPIIRSLTQNLLTGTWRY